MNDEQSNSLRFSTHFGITRDEEDDWFDPLLHRDSRFYIDPFLVFDDHDDYWAEAKAALPQYMSIVKDLLSKSNAEGDRYNRRATDLLTFPEPNEYLLGTSISKPQGRGPGKVLAKDMLRELAELPSGTVDAVNLVRGFDLFCSGFGVDMFSDMMGNLFIAKFIEYTQKVCKKHSIPTRPILVKRSQWDGRNMRWLEARHNLPYNPELDIAVLLTPERFLRQLPFLTADEYYEYLSSGMDENQGLRDLMNELVEEAFIRNDGPPTKRDRANIARILAHENPKKANDYIDLRAQDAPEPYDFTADSTGDFRWYETARTLFEELPPPTLPEDPRTAPVKDITLALIEMFKTGVEERSIWRTLWDEERTSPRKEDTIQAMMHEIWLPICKHANIDLSPEINKGRGPADFKLSRGSVNSIIEVKRDSNSKLDKGLTEQLPQYMRANEAESGAYVVMVYRDTFFDQAKNETLDRLAKQLRADGYNISLHIIDARPGTKQSASKL